MLKLCLTSVEWSGTEISAEGCVTSVDWSGLNQC